MNNKTSFASAKNMRQHSRERLLNPINDVLASAANIGQTQCFFCFRDDHLGNAAIKELVSLGYKITLNANGTASLIEW